MFDGSFIRTLGDICYIIMRNRGTIVLTSPVYIGRCVYTREKEGQLRLIKEKRNQ